MRHKKLYRITGIKEPWTAAAVQRLTHRGNNYGIDDGYVLGSQPTYNQNEDGGCHFDLDRIDTEEVAKCNVQE